MICNYKRRDKPAVGIAPTAGLLRRREMNLAGQPTRNERF
jgi:hypothetical protein